MADINNFSSELPSVITPSGMSLERQQYLYDKIRQFCSTEKAAELTCPKPVSVTVQQTAMSASQYSTLWSLSQARSYKNCSRQSILSRTSQEKLNCHNFYLINLYIILSMYVVLILKDTTFIFLQFIRQ